MKSAPTKKIIWSVRLPSPPPEKYKNPSASLFSYFSMEEFRSVSFWGIFVFHAPSAHSWTKMRKKKLTHLIYTEEGTFRLQY
ncbi:Uncharacterised protein [Vibrio parahaemolyticus]|nr:Uncharacterised protein [Vibrio parahaemolyticus]